MKNFHNWFEDKTGQKLDEISAQNIMNTPLTGMMNRGLERLDQATDGIEGSSFGQKRIMNVILHQVKQLPPQAQQKLGRVIMQMSRHPIEDQSVNPKARYEGN